VSGEFEFGPRRSAVTPTYSKVK